MLPDKRCRLSKRRFPGQNMPLPEIKNEIKNNVKNENITNFLVLHHTHTQHCVPGCTLIEVMLPSHVLSAHADLVMSFAPFFRTWPS